MNKHPLLYFYLINTCLFHPLYGSTKLPPLDEQNKRTEELTLEIVEKIQIPQQATPKSQEHIRRCLNIYRDQFNPHNFCLNFPEKLTDPEMETYRFNLFEAIKDGHLQAMLNFVITTYDNTEGIDSTILQSHPTGLPTSYQLSVLPNLSTCRFYLENPQITHTLLEKIATTENQFFEIEFHDYVTAIWLYSRNCFEGRKCPKNFDRALEYAYKAHRFGWRPATHWIAQQLNIPLPQPFFSHKIQDCGDPTLDIHQDIPPHDGKGHGLAAQASLISLPHAFQVMAPTPKKKKSNKRSVIHITPPPDPANMDDPD